MKLYIINILLLELSLQKYLILDLKRDNNRLQKINNKNVIIKEEEIMEILFYNDIFTLINVGRPKKEIRLFLTFDNDKTQINIKEYSKFRSRTYKYNNTTNESIDLFDFIENENNSNSCIINNYHFNLIEIEQNNEMSTKQSLVGLKPAENKSINTNILYQLKKNGKINKRIFSFIYTENSEILFKKEKILIGILPEGYNLNSHLNYPKNGILWTKLQTLVNINDRNDNQKWQFKIDSFYSNYNLTAINNTYIELILENNLIIAPDYFKSYLLDSFLNLLIDKEICREDYFYNEKNQKHYIYYLCNEIEEFSNKIIYFKNKDLNETFEIILKNLFFRYDRKLFFGILFEEEEKSKKVWKMGKMFLEKYSFVFDDDNKRIGYYKIKKENDNALIILISFIIFLCFLIILCFIGFILRNNKNIIDLKNNKKEKEKKE